MLPTPVKQKKRFSAACICLLLIATFFLAFEPVRVDGRSMAETLDNGELLLVSKAGYFFNEPNRFDVIICRYPDRAGKQFVKRLVGLPGDTVEIRNTILYINGSATEEEYIHYPANYYYAAYTLLENEYFVLGDNRSNSNDSHLIGPLRRSQIIGRVLRVFYPFQSMRIVQ